MELWNSFDQKISKTKQKNKWRIIVKNPHTGFK